MARGKPHDPQLKAAVTARLVAGEEPALLSKEFGIDKSILSRWKAAARVRVLKEVGLAKGTDFGDLLDDYLKELILTLTANAKLFRDETYVRKQSAHDVALFFGIGNDKAVRLLDARSRAHEASRTQETG